VKFCKHVENPSSLPACRDTTCIDPRIKACITSTCTNLGPQKMVRNSNVCAHTNWGVLIKVLASVNNAPWCVVRKSVLYLPVELHGHRGSAWRVIKCVPPESNGLYGKCTFVYEICTLLYTSTCTGNPYRSHFLFNPTGYGTGRLSCIGTLYCTYGRRFVSSQTGSASSQVR
jgi:hypothetical protein